LPLPPLRCRETLYSLFVWLVDDGRCWFVLREKHCWLVAGGWFVLREKYCWLVGHGVWNPPPYGGTSERGDSRCPTTVGHGVWNPPSYGTVVRVMSPCGMAFGS
jgi:hypothetical protein